MEENRLQALVEAVAASFRSADDFYGDKKGPSVEKMRDGIVGVRAQSRINSSHVYFRQTDYTSDKLPRGRFLQKSANYSNQTTLKRNHKSNALYDGQPLKYAVFITWHCYY